jgi:putative glycosyl hydrolase protein
VPVGDEPAPAWDPTRQTVVIRDVLRAERDSGPGARRKGGRGRPIGVPRPAQALVAAVVVALVAGGGAFVYSTRASLEVEGIADSQRLSRRDLASLRLRITSTGPGTVGVELNGERLPLMADGDTHVVGSEALREAIVDGTNTLVVSQPGRLGIGGATVERTFTFDPAGPVLMVPAAVSAPDPGRPVVLRGLIDGAVELTVDGTPIPIEPGGAFTSAVPEGATAIELVATDAEGRAADATVQVTASPPGARYPATAAVHVTAADWADPAVREPIIALARSGAIDAVELDIKDERGEIGYASDVPLAVAAGTVRQRYDARKAIDELHGTGARVIGRIVCFLDPTLASWAWENGRQEMVVMQGSGGPLDTDYGTAAFTNVANPQVRQYHIDLALEAARLGFDEILYDYVRRPEGDTSAMYFPGLEGALDVAVARFVADTNVRLASTEALFGVSAFGIAATRPQQIAQDLRLLAPHVD